MPDATTNTSYARTRRPMLDAPQRSRGRRSRALLVSLPMFAVFAAFGSIVWLAYVDRPDRPVGEPPLIQADHRPIKVPPDALAGRELAAEGDVAELFTDRPPAQPERILPPPEEPILPGEAEAAETPPAPADAPPVAQAEAPPAEIAPPAELAPPPQDPAPAETEVAEPAPEPAPAPEPTVSSPAPASPAVDEAAIAEGDAALERLFADLPRPDPAPPAPDGAAPPPAQTPPAAQPAPQPQPSPSPEVRPAIAPPAATATGQDGAAALPEPGPVLPAPSPGEVTGAQPSYRIQLAAVREEQDARRAWDLFRVDLGRQLAGVDPIIERAETANGVFYRVQVGSFSDAQSAEALCDNLKRQNASCFVIRR